MRRQSRVFADMVIAKLFPLLQVNVLTHSIERKMVIPLNHITSKNIVLTVYRRVFCPRVSPAHAAKR